MKFVEVPTNDNIASVRGRLLGGGADFRLTGCGTGELGAGEPTLVYLSGLADIDLSFGQELYGVITKRRYLDSKGNEWHVSPDVWLVGALGHASSGGITAEHWLATAFDKRLHVFAPQSQREYVEAVDSMLSDLGASQCLSDDAKAVFGLLQPPQGNLHAVRRWVELAALRATGRAVVSASDLQSAMAEDVQSLLSTVEYRGSRLSLGSVERWTSQFPPELRPVALDLAVKLARRYYVGHRALYGALHKLHVESAIPERSTVTFCQWQEPGRGSPHVAHDLKNMAFWRTSDEVDLRRDTSRWPERADIRPRWFIVADDFVGSGTSMASVICESNPNLASLLARYPQATLHILVVVAFESGLRRVATALGRFRKRARVLAAHILDDGDRCFHETSSVLTDPTVRSRMREFCARVARAKFSGLDPQHRLGWKGIAGLTVFSNTVPNTSLPVLWYTASDWHPLFPAAGLLRD
jgi:hypothetical protein